MGLSKFRRPPLLSFALALCCAGAAAGCETRRANEQRPNQNGAQQQQPAGQTPTPATGDATPAVGGQGEKPVTVDGALKTLGAGGYSRVEEAFVFVARDAQGYKELRGLVPDLPELGADAFKASAVVAAFLGQRRTGGYAVEIARDAQGALVVSEKSPPKGAMTTMALTAAYSVASVPAPDGGPVRLRLGPPWRERARPYRVASGEFTTMGGFAGVREPFKVTGTLGVLRHGDFATVVFDLAGAGDERPRALSDAVTAKLDSGKLSASLDPGTFIPPPRPRLRAEVQFTEGESKLLVTLDGLRTSVADGFGGRGTLEAEATAPPPPRRAAAQDDPQ